MEVAAGSGWQHLRCEINSSIKQIQILDFLVCFTHDLDVPFTYVICLARQVSHLRCCCYNYSRFVGVGIESQGLARSHVASEGGRLEPELEEAVWLGH